MSIFFYVSLLIRKLKWHKLGVRQNLVLSQWNKWKKWHKFFIFTFLFGAFKRWNLSEALKRSVKIKIMSFFISINYFRMTETGQVDEVFSPRIFINIVKWGKEQPKVTNLACTSQPLLLEMKLICQLTGATSENHLCKGFQFTIISSNRN